MGTPIHIIFDSFSFGTLKSFVFLLFFVLVISRSYYFIALLSLSLLLSLLILFFSLLFP